MKLNNYNYCHVKIRKLCQLLEMLTNMKQITDLNNEYDQIHFAGKYGYITIDYRLNACLTLGIHLNDIQLKIVQDIMLYNNWLETGQRLKKLHK